MDTYMGTEFRNLDKRGLARGNGGESYYGGV